MPLRHFNKFMALSIVSLPLWAASNTFVTQGPAPAFDSFLGDHNSDVGSPQPIATHPTNANTIFVGGVNGGIWRTQNFGTTWTPLTDHQASLSIASLAFDPTVSSHNTILAGLGITSNGAIGNFNLGDPESRGGKRLGLLYSQDGGNTWKADLAGNATLSGKTVVDVVARNFNPNTSGTLLVGTFEPLTPDSTAPGYGLYRSTDGGQSFVNYSSTAGFAVGPVTSVVGDRSNPSIIYAAVTTPTHFASTALYKSTDNGTTWTKVFSAPNSGGLINGSVQTVLEAVTGPSGSVAVKLVQLNGPFLGQVEGVFLSTNSGSTWQSLPMPAENVNPGGQGVENSDIAIDPSNPNRVYLTGTYLDTEAFPLSAYILQPATAPISFSQPNDGTRSHADSRFLAFDVQGRLLVGSDGGIDVRTNPSSPNGSWKSINGNLSIWQPYASAYDANKNIILCAGQDTGIAVQTGPNQLTYNDLPITGDGVNAVINDQTSKSYYYSSVQGLAAINRVINGDPSTIKFLTLNFMGNPLSDFDTHFLSPFVLNRIDATKIAIGGSTDVFITHDDLVSTTLNLTSVGTGFSTVLPIAYGTRDNTNALLVGAQNSPFLFFTASPTASGSVPGLPNYEGMGGLPPSSVAFDIRTQNRFYVADTVNLFQSKDRGASFTVLTSNITTPAINNSRPTSVEFLSNNGVNALFVGGVNNSGAQSTLVVADADTAGNLSGWRSFGQLTLPNTVVEQIVYNNKSDTLLANTYGRGNYLMYDVTSNFPSATELWFGKANNNSTPNVSVLTNGTSTNRPLKKFGKGTLSIIGAATYTGLTTVFGGRLALVNSTSRIPKNVTVKTGCTLSGIGSVGGTVTMESGSTLSPGNTIGTLTVGALTLNTGCTTNIQISPTAASAVHVNGVATLAGSVHVTQNAGTYPATKSYEILRAKGGIKGSFNATVLGGLPGFKFKLTRQQNSIFLQYSDPQISLTNLSGNNLTFARYLNEDAMDSPAQLLICDLPEHQQEKALTAASPARNAFPTFIEDNTCFAFSDMLDTHFSSMHYNRVFEQLAMNGCYCYQPKGCCEATQSDFWIDGFYDYAQQDAQSQTPGFDFNSEGIFVGYDSNCLENAMLGISAGYAHSNFYDRHHRGKGHINYYAVTPYGMTYIDNAYVETALTFSYNQIKNKRHIIFTDYDERASSSHHSYLLMPHLGLGYDIAYCWGIFEPFVAFDWVVNWDRGFKEHGSEAFDMKQKSSTSSMLRSQIGFQLYQTLEWGCGTTFVLRETAAYVNKKPFDVGRVKSALVGNPHYFTQKSFKEAQNLITVGISGMLNTKNGYYGMFSYDGERGSGYNAYEVQLKLGKFF